MSIWRHSVEQLLDQAVHVEELVQLLLGVEDSHNLPHLLALLHDCTEERDCVSHGLCTFIASLHDRYTVRLAARTNLHQRVEHSMALANLLQLRDRLVELTLDTRRVCCRDHTER